MPKAGDKPVVSEDAALEALKAAKKRDMVVT